MLKTGGSDGWSGSGGGGGGECQGETACDRAFRSCNALSPDSAVPFSAESHLEGRWFDRLRDAGAIAPATNGGYYLDRAKLAAWEAEVRARSLRIVAWVLAISVIVALVAFVIGKVHG